MAYTCFRTGVDLPGVPILFPVNDGYVSKNDYEPSTWYTHPDTRDLKSLRAIDLVKPVFREAWEMAGIPSGTWLGVPCLWAPPETKCFRVQPAGLPRALYSGFAGDGDKRWYTTLRGMNVANLDNGAGLWNPNEHHEVVRQTLAEVAAMGGVRQIVIDPEAIWVPSIEMFPAQHPVFSRNYQPGGRTFAPSVIAIDRDFVPVDEGAGFT